ncbi:hypothetical protein Lal_00027242 [Lupinus albus]|nr:hypothetical protein Lal_00027242 [Lupinus albus]
MGFSIDPRERRSYIHRTDKPSAQANQTEPTQPNPPAPQPSEFQAQPSSSALMPTNQMIMDELLSLRGYITSRMDALDHQNQQIQDEIHRLSYKINCMDIDEDSTEP